jgi:dolichol-phosphate mannosyltransferase
MNISVVLPTYDECKNIVDLIDAIEAETAPHAEHLQIVVVDDNSPDGTAQVVQQRIQKPGPAHIDLHVRTEERGLASAIQ